MGLLITLTRLVPMALGIIGAVEKIFKLKGQGKEKKEAYLEGIMTALGVTESTMNKDLINDEQFKTLLGNLADTVVGINNFIRDFKPKEDK